MTESLKTQDASMEALMGEIVDEFLERLGHDERPEVEEYARHYPQLATVLRQMLPALEVIHLSAPDRLRPTGCPAAEIEPETSLGDSRILREVGRGGMGIVYEAEQISLGRRVALKVLPFAAAMQSKQLQRFKTEAQAAGHSPLVAARKAVLEQVRNATTLMSFLPTHAPPAKRKWEEMVWEEIGVSLSVHFSACLQCQRKMN